MKRRATRLPDRGGPVQRPPRRRVGLWLVVAVFALGGVLAVRDQVLPGVERWWQDDLGPRLRGEPVRRATEAPPGGPVRDRVPVIHPEDTVEAVQFAPGPPETLHLRLADFAPVDFEVEAVSHPLALAAERPPSLRVLPGRPGAPLRYGVLPSGVGFVLAAEGHSTRLYVDHDGDGELGPGDGLAPADPAGGFATAVALPLARVLPGADPAAVYRLWVFAPGDSDPFDGLRVYARTQLRGVVHLQGRAYTAWLADNEHLDGDYRNDGIGVDLDGDGRLSVPREWVRPDRPLVVGERSYRFVIAP